MAALARAFAWVYRANIDVETLKTLAIFSGLGLLISLVCAMSYGLDLSAALF